MSGLLSRIPEFCDFAMVEREPGSFLTVLDLVSVSPAGKPTQSAVGYPEMMGAHLTIGRLALRFAGTSGCLLIVQC
jgi:hypothetical protein